MRGTCLMDLLYERCARDAHKKAVMSTSCSPLRPEISQRRPAHSAAEGAKRCGSLGVGVKKMNILAITIVPARK